MTTTGLVRLTIDAPARRMDLALPERAPVAEILPALLRHAGESLADDGVADGGWVLRRADGGAIAGTTSLAAQRVRDGAVLHLVPSRMEWPELEYDDLADTIAAGSGRTGRLWGPRHTRFTGLACTGVLALLALVAIVRAGPPWSLPGWVACAAAGLLLAAGTVLARALGDAGAGAVLAALALPHAFLSGALLSGGGHPLAGFAAPQLLCGCAALLVAAVLGHLGVVAGATAFTCGATVGLLGGAAALIATTEPVGAAGAAAIVGGAVLIFSPLFGPISVRLGRVPMPVLPRTAADLVRDDPQPPRHEVYAKVVRAEQLLTGMIGGAAVVGIACEATLAADRRTSAVLLLGIVAAGLCVRARLYPALRQRVPLLSAGLAGIGCLLAGPLMAQPDRLLTVAVPALGALAALAVTVGLVHSSRVPSAYLGRYAELIEVLLVLACVPVVCAVLGVYGLVRGLGG